MGDPSRACGCLGDAYARPEGDHSCMMHPCTQGCLHHGGWTITCFSGIGLLAASGGAVGWELVVGTITTLVGTAGNIGEGIWQCCSNPTAAANRTARTALEADRAAQAALEEGQELLGQYKDVATKFAVAMGHRIDTEEDVLEQLGAVLGGIKGAAADGTQAAQTATADTKAAKRALRQAADTLGINIEDEAEASLKKAKTLGSAVTGVVQLLESKAATADELVLAVQQQARVIRQLAEQVVQLTSANVKVQSVLADKDPAAEELDVEEQVLAIQRQLASLKLQGKQQVKGLQTEDEAAAGLAALAEGYATMEKIVVRLQLYLAMLSKEQHQYNPKMDPEAEEKAELLRLAVPILEHFVKLMVASIKDAAPLESLQVLAAKSVEAAQAAGKQPASDSDSE